MNLFLQVRDGLFFSLPSFLFSNEEVWLCNKLVLCKMALQNHLQIFVLLLNEVQSLTKYMCIYQSLWKWKAVSFFWYQTCLRHVLGFEVGTLETMTLFWAFPFTFWDIFWSKLITFQWVILSLEKILHEDKCLHGPSFIYEITGDFPDSVICHEPYYLFCDKLHIQVFLAVITMNIYHSLTLEKLF